MRNNQDLSAETEIVEHIEAALEYIEWWGRNFKTPQCRSSAWFLLREYMMAQLPYCIEDGYVLNRYYKPLGVPDVQSHVSYEDYPCHVNIVLPDEAFVPANPSPDINHLYQSGSAPWGSKANWEDYRERLGLLMLSLRNNTTGLLEPA